LTSKGKTFRSLLVNSILFLLLAAFLEVGGDALVRWGLKSGRVLGFILGALLLFTYGLVVNLPKWDFSRLLGVYIALFFVVSQATGALFFNEILSIGRMVGGFLVLSGSLCMMVWK